MEDPTPLSAIKTQDCSSLCRHEYRIAASGRLVAEKTLRLLLGRYGARPSVAFIRRKDATH